MIEQVLHCTPIRIQLVAVIVRKKIERLHGFVSALKNPFKPASLSHFSNGKVPSEIWKVFLVFEFPSTTNPTCDNNMGTASQSLSCVAVPLPPRSTKQTDVLTPKSLFAK